MKFIFGLLIGVGLMFGWYHTIAVPKMKAVQSELSAEKARSIAALDETRRINDAALGTAKEKIQNDYEVQLKAAEDKVASLASDLTKARNELTVAQVQTPASVEKKAEEKITPVPVVPEAKLTQKPVTPTTVAPAAVEQTVRSPAAPVQSSAFNGPRPTSEIDSKRPYRHSQLRKNFNGTVTTSYYYSAHP